jgi:hypothetical protein
VDQSGDVSVYDGNYQPSLATLSSTANTWSFQNDSNWSCGGNESYGEVAAYKQYVFGSDMVGYQQPQNGIVRFDLTGGAPVLFGQGNNYEQLALGQDGLLYGLNYNNGSHPPTVDAYNPDTRTFVRTIQLNGGPDTDVRSIAVDSSGQIYAATWGGYIVKYDSSGNYVTSIVATPPNGGYENLVNIALDTDGQIAVGGRGGDVILSDTSLTSVTSFATNQWNAFVTFDHYLGAGSGTSATSFSSLSAPTISYGQSSVVLGGLISAGSAIPTGNVKITLNGVTQSAVINPNNGYFAAVFDPSELPVGSYTLQYSYAGNSTYSATTSSTTLTDSYADKLLHKFFKGVNPGAADAIQFEVTSAAGVDLSSSNLTVTAMQIMDSHGNTYTPQSVNNSNPGNVFLVVPGHKRHSAYWYDLDTTGLTAGQYTLLVQIGNDPVLHDLAFTIK